MSFSKFSHKDCSRNYPRGWQLFLSSGWGTFALKFVLWVDGCRTKICPGDGGGGWQPPGHTKVTPSSPGRWGNWYINYVLGVGAGAKWFVPSVGVPKKFAVWPTRRISRTVLKDKNSPLSHSELVLNLETSIERMSSLKVHEDDVLWLCADSHYHLITERSFCNITTVTDDNRCWNYFLVSYNSACEWKITVFGVVSLLLVRAQLLWLLDWCLKFSSQTSQRHMVDNFCQHCWQRCKHLGIQQTSLHHVTSIPCLLV